MAEHIRQFNAYAGRTGVVAAVMIVSTLGSMEDIQDAPPEIDITQSRLYEMPDFTQELPFVVSVDEIDKQTQEVYRRGTGAIIAGYVLTAGHVYADEVHAGDACQKNLAASSDGDPHPHHRGWNITALTAGVAETSKGQNYLDKPDYALFKTDGGQGLPESILADRDVNVGEVLTFTNYQTVATSIFPDAKPMLRHPSFNEPAIFNGIVLGSAGNEERIGILTGMGSRAAFNDYGDSELAEGGSGGPVWDSEGKIVGISNDKRRAAVNAKDIKNMFGVVVKGAVPDQQFSVAWMQPVHTQVFTSLKANLKSCNFTNNDLPKKLQKPGLLSE